MRYFRYAFLGLFSLGFLGLMVGIGGVVYVISYYGQNLPDYSQLKDYEPPIVTRLYAGDGRLMAEFAQEKRVFVPIEAVPDLVKNAFIAAEDKNFYKHKGVDFLAVVRAAISNFKNMGTGKRPVGASTITQQVAKNFLLSNEVSYKRKIREAILAYRIERAMSKKQLLELYMNEIYLGFNSYGVAAAALNYYNKSLAELTIPEAAYLAALPKAPNNYHPVRKKKAAVSRRNWVIGRMEEDGYITKAQAELAKLAAFETVALKNNVVHNADYFAEEVRRELARDYGEKALYGGGLVVRGTLDPVLQDLAVKVLRDGLMTYDKRHGWRGAAMHFKELEDWQVKLRNYGRPEGLLREWKMAVVLGVEPIKAEIGFVGGARGRIKLEHARWARKSLSRGYALGPEIISLKKVLRPGDVIMVEPVEVEKEKEEKEGEEKSYALKQVPEIQGGIIVLDPHTGRVLAMQGGWQYTGSEFNRATQAQRQPGSAFKPFVYLAALDNGFTPATLVLDAPFVMEDRPGNVWKPTNYTGEYYGPTPLRIGVEKSRNLMTVRLADYLGMEKVSEYAMRLGITKNMPPLLSYALGAGETTLLKLTTAYAMLVNGGKKITPTFVDRIQDRRGKTVLRHDKRSCQGCGMLIKWENQETPDIADMREQIADPRTAYQIVSILEGVVKRGTGIRIKSLGYTLAGKTGTTNESKDAWFIGFSPDLVVGVFAGFDEPRSLGKRETGSSVAVPIFKDFMAVALKDKTPTPFRIPPGIRQVQINAETGVRARPGDKRVIWEAFVTGTEPTDEKFILDGRGISLMPTVSGVIGESANTGTGGIY